MHSCLKAGLLKAVTLAMVVIASSLIVSCGNDDSGTVEPGASANNNPNTGVLRLTIQIPSQLMQQVDSDQTATINVTIEDKQSNQSIANAVMETRLSATMHVNISDLPMGNHNMFISISYMGDYLLGWKEGNVNIGSDDQAVAFTIDPPMQSTPAQNGLMLTWPDKLGESHFLMSYLASTTERCGQINRVHTGAIISESTDKTYYLVVVYAQTINGKRTPTHSTISKFARTQSGSLRSVEISESDIGFLPTLDDQGRFTCRDSVRDMDEDGIADNADNCPATANANQINRYGDPSIGDACEDTDRDRIVDLTTTARLSPITIKLTLIISRATPWVMSVTQI